MGSCISVAFGIHEYHCHGSPYIHKTRKDISNKAVSIQSDPISKPP